MSSEKTLVGRCQTFRSKEFRLLLCSTTRTEKWSRNWNICFLQRWMTGSESSSATYFHVWWLLPKEIKSSRWCKRASFWKDAKNSCQLMIRTWSMLLFTWSAKLSSWETTLQEKMATILWKRSRIASSKIESWRRLTTRRTLKSASWVRSWKKSLKITDLVISWFFLV